MREHIADQRSILASFELAVAQVEAWNRDNPTQRPRDCESDRVMAAKLRAYIRACETGQGDADELAESIAEYSKRILAEEEGGAQ